jgi:hypothetical protein
MKIGPSEVQQAEHETKNCDFGHKWLRQVSTFLHLPFTTRRCILIIQTASACPPPARVGGRTFYELRGTGRGVVDSRWARVVPPSRWNGGFGSTSGREHTHAAVLLCARYQKPTLCRARPVWQGPPWSAGGSPRRGANRCGDRWPSARIASIQPRIASTPLVIASSIVAPSDMQPGRSENSIR